MKQYRIGNFSELPVKEGRKVLPNQEFKFYPDPAMKKKRGKKGRSC